MNKYIYKIYNFMRGRNGIDDLYKIMFILFIIIFLINSFINNYILDIFELLVLVIILYRFFSKNLLMRKRENDYYLKLRSKLLKRANLIKRRWDDRNSFVYRKCSRCKKILRLPLKRGVHMCRCPKCGNRFKVRCFRKEKIKIEIIKNR